MSDGHTNGTAAAERAAVWLLPEPLAKALQNNLMAQREALLADRNVQRFLQCAQLLNALSQLTASPETLAQQAPRNRRPRGRAALVEPADGVTEDSA